MAAGDAILLCIPALPIHTGMLNRSRSLHRRVAENPGNRKSQVYPQLGTVFPVQFSRAHTHAQKCPVLPTTSLRENRSRM